MTEPARRLSTHDPNSGLIFDAQLATIDPSTGVATGIGSSNRLSADGFSFVEGLAFDPGIQGCYARTDNDHLRLDRDLLAGVFDKHPAIHCVVEPESWCNTIQVDSGAFRPDCR